MRPNERALLHLLRLHGPVSKAELARLSEMSAQGVSIIVERLLDLDLVRKGDKMRGRVGQPSTPIELNAAGASSVGVFVSSDSAQIVIADFSGRIVLEDVVKDLDIGSSEHVVRIAGTIEKMASKIDGEFWGRRVGIAVAARQSILARLREPLPLEMRKDGYTGLADSFRKHFEVPVYCVNDIRAACIAELSTGGSVATQTSLYVNIGDTLGCGIVLEGKPIGEEDRLSSSLHSLPVPGRDGASVQDYASFGILKRGITAAGYRFGEQIERDFLDTRDIFDAWKNDAVSALALSIQAACATLPMDRVVIASRLGRNELAGFVSELKFAVENDMPEHRQMPEIVIGSFGPHARALGTAIVPFFKAFGTGEMPSATRKRRSAVA